MIIEIRHSQADVPIMVRRDTGLSVEDVRAALELVPEGATLETVHARADDG